MRNVGGNLVMSTEKHLRLVLVTPETTLLDEPVAALRFPLYDGQFGVLPGRAPVVGRLGFGELRVSTATGVQSFFIEEGFVQVKGLTVTILTNHAVVAAQLDQRAAQDELESASKLVPTTDLAFAAKFRRQARSRSILALVRHPH